MHTQATNPTATQTRLIHSLPTEQTSWEELRINQNLDSQQKWYIEIESEFNREGQCDFSLYWFAHGFHLGASWRGQNFRANPDHYILKHQAQGERVVLVKRKF